MSFPSSEASIELAGQPGAAQSGVLVYGGGCGYDGEEGGDGSHEATIYHSGEGRVGGVPDQQQGAAQGGGHGNGQVEGCDRVL